MSQEQVLEQLKLLLPSVGMLLSMLGFMTPADTAKWSIAILAVVGPSMILGGMIWGAIDKTQASLVAKVDVLAKDKDSDVQGVVMSDTPGGHDIANSLPGPQTVAAGTPAAVELAKAAA